MGGYGEETATDYSYSCNVTPCDACPDDSLKAECCSKCLERACSKAEPSKGGKLHVCRGCERGGESSRNKAEAMLNQAAAKIAEALEAYGLWRVVQFSS